MVHIVPIDEKSMQQVKESSMEVDLDFFFIFSDM
jgi:hypothetical protein